MNQPREIVLPNHQLAWGRVGLALLFTPLLVGLGLMFLLAEDGNRVIGGLLLLGPLPFIVFATLAPFSVRIGEQVVVRYLLSQRTYSRSDIRGVRYGEIATQFSLGRLIPGWEIGVKSYRAATLITTSGKQIQTLIDISKENQLREIFDTIHG